MKSLLVIAVAIYLVGGGLAWAQSTSSATGSSAHRATSGTGPASNVHSFNMDLRMQMRLIQKDLKSGKITSAQARVAWEGIKNIRKTENGFFLQNGNREITADQKAQLEQLLSQNGVSL